MVAIAVAILTLDLLTKYLLDARLEFGVEYKIIPHLFNFQMVYNMGAAWGMLAGKQVFLIVLTLVFLAIFTFYYVKEKNKTWLLTIGFGCLYGGCIGNLYDRLGYGYVRDFIQFDFWKGFPVFNFADAFLCLGVLLFAIYLIMYFVKNSKNKDKNTQNTQKNDENLSE